MNHKKALKKILILSVVFIMILCFVIIFVFLDIKSKNENIFKLEDELSSQTEKSQYLLKMQKIVRDANNSIDQIDSSILKSDGGVKIIEDVENLAEKNGLEVKIEAITIEEIPFTNDSDIMAFKIKAKTKGSWSGTYNFISELESLEEKIKINRFVLNLTTDDFDSSTNNIELKNLKVKWQSSFEVYFLKYK